MVWHGMAPQSFNVHMNVVTVDDHGMAWYDCTMQPKRHGPNHAAGCCVHACIPYHALILLQWPVDADGGSVLGPVNHTLYESNWRNIWIRVEFCSKVLGGKTRLESSIKKFEPHLIYDGHSAFAPSKISPFEPTFSV